MFDIGNVGTGNDGTGARADIKRALLQSLFQDFGKTRLIDLFHQIIGVAAVDIDDVGTFQSGSNIGFALSGQIKIGQLQAKRTERGPFTHEPIFCAVILIKTCRGWDCDCSGGRNRLWE